MTPKATIKEEKKEAVRMLADALKAAHSTTLIDYTGMDVVTLQDLRSKLANAGSRILIAKNTLIKLAAKDAGLPEDLGSEHVLSGQTAIVFADTDPVAPIQIIGNFNKETELAAFKAGVVEGTFQDKDGMSKISNLPSRDELAAQVVGGIAAPLYGIVGTLQANLQKLVFILDQRSKQLT